MIAVSRVIPNSSVTVTDVRIFNEEALQESKQLFEEYKIKEVILDCNFEDNRWFLNNESKMISIKFDLNHQIFEAQKVRQIGEYEEWIQSLKAYILYSLSKYVIGTIRGNLVNIINVLEKTQYFRKGVSSSLQKNNSYDHLLPYAPCILEYIDFYNREIEVEYIDLFQNLLENYMDRSKYKKINSNNSRVLGNLESMFVFERILDCFWKSATANEREEFFPIKLWWEITTLYPMRITEFIITPYDCIQKENGFNYFICYKSNLKGSFKNPKVTHKISTDYSEHKIRITSDIADLIEEYKSIVDHYDSEINFYPNKSHGKFKRNKLLSHRAYFKNLNFKGAISNVYQLDLFTYENLNYLFMKFYKKIVCDKYGYVLVSKESESDELKDNEIEVIQLMDTRHYAFINLVLNDVEPMFIKEISGHKNIESCYHYYNHVHKFVKCYTYNMAKKMRLKAHNPQNVIEVETLKGFNISNPLYHKIFEKDDVDSEINKKCKSKQKHFEDCIAVNNECESCPYVNTEAIITNNLRQKLEHNDMLIRLEVESLVALIKSNKTNKLFLEQYHQKVNYIKSLRDKNTQILYNLEK